MIILGAYDGTLNAKDVLRYGLYRAKTTGGELKILHILDSGMLMDLEGMNAYESVKREAAVHLAEAKRIVEEAGQGVKVDLISVEGSLERELISYAKKNRVDLVLVPQKYANIAREAPCRVSVVPRDFSTFKVLLVDDEAAFANALSQRLNLRNFKTDVVTSGEAALAYVKNEAPDIIILDLRMPGMDGLEVLRSVKTTNPSIQIIILSGRETAGDREEAKKYGAFDFVNKPAEIESLAGKVKEAYWTKIERPAEEFIVAA